MLRIHSTARIRNVQPILPSCNQRRPDVVFAERLEINQTLPISSFNVPPPEGGTHEYADGTVTGCPTGSAIAAGTICTIPVTFSPTFLGVRGVPLIVATTSSGEFKFGLTGVGIAPQTALLPGIIQTMAGNGKAHSATPMVLRQLPA